MQVNLLVFLIDFLFQTNTLEEVIVFASFVDKCDAILFHGFMGKFCNLLWLSAYFMAFLLKFISLIVVHVIPDYNCVNTS